MQVSDKAVDKLLQQTSRLQLASYILRSSILSERKNNYLNMLQFAVFIGILQVISVIGALTCNVKEFDAVGDGVIYDDVPFSRAFAACKEGGKVYVPAGDYLLSPFNFTSNTELYLENGATLLATTDASRWPVVAPLPSYPGTDPRQGAFIGGEDVHNITISGFGKIDGQGKAWWDADQNHELSYGRPRLIEPMYCSNLVIRDVEIVDPPFWAVHPYVCDNILIENVRFSAPVTSPNTDGIDPDSCSNVIIRNFTAICGDDAIAIKSGKNEYGRAFNVSSHDILIEGGYVGPSSGIDIGSEMSGGVYNVMVRDVTFHGSLFSTRIKAGRERGSSVHNVTYENLTLSDNVMGPCITMYYGGGERALPNDEGTPHVYDITYRSHRGSALTGGGFFCLPESPCHNIVLEDMNISSRVGGFECIHAYGYTTDGSTVSPESCLKSEDTFLSNEESASGIVVAPSGAVPATSVGGGEVDLSANGSNGAGLGFAFATSDGMSRGKRLVSVLMPECKIGPLDAIYFYVYGCKVPADMVLVMAQIIGEDFLYTSDKSLTIETDVSAKSLLLANAWGLSLEYGNDDDNEACSAELTVIEASKGCVAKNKCAISNSIEVGCGDLSCTGCVLENFFSEFTFKTAVFLAN